MQYDWFNAILCERDAAPADETYIDESLAYFKSKNTSGISLWMDECSLVLRSVMDTRWI